MNNKHYQLAISGMQCADCETAIEEAVMALPGIIRAQADFSNERLELELDASVISLATVCAAIQQAGYSCDPKTKKIIEKHGRPLWVLAGLLGIALLLVLQRYVDFTDMSARIGDDTDYGLLFLIGIFTSFHCVGMCGGFVLGYTAVNSQQGRLHYRQHLQYGLGKLASYTAFGALFGWLGGAISFTDTLRSLVLVAAGGFLLIYGLGMMESFHGLRRLQIRLPQRWALALASQRRRLGNPLSIGLLNGLMIACGPLQAMYVLAAGTGSAAKGAALLAVFALGTLPLMFVFGSLANLVTANTTRGFLKVSGLIIMALGLVMLNRGLLLAGNGLDAHSLWSRAVLAAKARFTTWQHGHADATAHIQEGYQIIYMEAQAHAYIPGEYRLRKNIPVKWVINVKQLSACNQQILVPALGLTIDLKPGLQLVEFTPLQTGVISWSCAMGMIPGAFIVSD